MLTDVVVCVLCLTASVVWLRLWMMLANLYQDMDMVPTGNFQWNWILMMARKVFFRFRLGIEHERFERGNELVSFTSLMQIGCDAYEWMRSHSNVGSLIFRSRNVHLQKPLQANSKFVSNLECWLVLWENSAQPSPSAFYISFFSSSIFFLCVTTKIILFRWRAGRVERLQNKGVPFTFNLKHR